MYDRISEQIKVDTDTYNHNVEEKCCVPAYQTDANLRLYNPLRSPIQNQSVLPLYNSRYKNNSDSNNGPLPDQIRLGIEEMTGLYMGDVKVHYHSDKPSQFQALAYTKGMDIYVAPGQEAHLPHEAWHVVQQAQGKVRPTLQMNGVHINDNSNLEQEANDMGNKIEKMQLTADNIYKTDDSYDLKDSLFKREDYKKLNSEDGNLKQLSSISINQNRAGSVNDDVNDTAIIQRQVINGGDGSFYSDLDAYCTKYYEYSEAKGVDDVLKFLKNAIEEISNGVGRMDAFSKARIGRIKEGAWPSWIPTCAQKNLGVQEMFRQVLAAKKEKEREWGDGQPNTQRCSEMLQKEGYLEAKDVYRSYEQASGGGQQAGYREQLKAHKKEMMSWNLAQIEPHYMSSQGDTKKRADSLIIRGETQSPQSQYYPPEEEIHTAMLVDHKVGYRDEEMAKKLIPSVQHAARALPVEYKGDVLPTTTSFQFPYGASSFAKKTIIDSAMLEREQRPSAFSGGLKINSDEVLSPANADEMIKRQCGCAGLSDEDTVTKIHGIINGYLFEQGVCTQVGMQLSVFGGSLTKWFDDLAKDVRSWLTPKDIYKLCRQHK